MGRNLNCQKLRLMLKFSYARCLGLISPAISSHFTLKMCAATYNCKKITKTSYFGCSELFKVTDVNTPEKLVTCACYDLPQSCAYLRLWMQPCYARWANNGTITTFGGTPFDAFVPGESFLQRHEICHKKTKIFVATHSEDFVVL